jgi:hypothetical protein
MSNSLSGRVTFLFTDHVQVFKPIGDAFCAAAILPLEVAEAARARGAQLDLQTTVEQLLTELKQWVVSA